MEMQINRSQLSALSVFQGFSDQDIEELEKKAATHRFIAGDIVFEEGDPGDSFYLIVSGSVRISRNIHPGPGDGEQLLLGVRMPGEIFGEMSLLDWEPRSARASTDEETILLSFNRDQFLSLMRSYPSFFLSLLRLLSGRVREFLSAQDSLAERVEKLQREIDGLKKSGA